MDETVSQALETFKVNMEAMLEPMTIDQKRLFLDHCDNEVGKWQDALDATETEVNGYEGYDHHDI